ncbi:MAG: AraC family transcriptional regulator [Bacteroidaceae bacterium]|nr:AraC family transcriptional regulator [Bacteroidaceae bacterium]
MAIKIKDIDQYNAYFHQKTLHPLISVGDLSKADMSLFDPIDFDMYCVVLMDEDFGGLCKDGKDISYRPGTVFTLMPGQVVQMRLKPGVRPKGWMLVFRPELLVKAGLGRDFYMFNFFSYEASEALELSSTERSTILNCLANIFTELHTPVDHLTDHMLRLGIGHLLSYCKRFYERQFDTKCKQNSSILTRLDALLDSYLSSGMPEQKGQPTVAWCAEQFHLSANYFGDVIKRELHVTAQEYIQRKIVSAAKMMLRDPRLSITEIAESLGFAYPNHFTRLFHKKVGISPSDFRKTI